MTLEVARGQRGRAPGTVTFLSGDVHHSYVSEAVATKHARRRADRRAEPDPAGGLLPDPQPAAPATAVPRRPCWRTAWPVRSATWLPGRPRCPDAPLHWKLLRGPWFDNNLATLEVTGRGLRLWWATGLVENGAHDRPRLVKVAEVTVD